MKLVNLGCGDTKLPEPWVNVDTFHSMFAPGTPERNQIDMIGNYVDAQLLEPLPFDDYSVSGLLASHLLEHFNAQDGLKLLKEVHRILGSGSSVIVSVPDASYFRRVYPEDRNENWNRLYDTTDPNNPIPTFFEAALWFNEHAAILTEDAVWSYLTMAGFKNVRRLDPVSFTEDDPIMQMMHKELNRRKFSLVMVGTKP